MKIIRSRNAKIVAGVSVLAVAGIIAFQGSEVEQTPIASAPEKTQIQNRPNENTLQIALSRTEPVNTAAVEEEIEDPFEGREVKYRFQQIASHFAEEIKYPTYSRPIRSENDLVEYLPNRAVKSSRPINLDDVDGEIDEAAPRIALKTSQFNYYPGDKVEAFAEVTGLSGPSSITLAGTIRVNGEVVAEALDITQSDTGDAYEQQQFSLRFGDLSGAPANDQGDMDVVVEFTIDGQVYAITSLIRYPSTIASLDGVGSVHVDGEYLKIPMKVSTSSPGIHAIKANLYDAESDTPLVHLNVVEELTSESGELVLKAHIAALKEMGHEGPYELRDLALSRGASAPKYTVEHGLVEASSYPISGFAFSDYEDKPYVDERAQARLDFLTRLGSIN